MIGVIASDNERRAVEEFFELFKTPWEYARSSARYDVLLISSDLDVEPSAPCTIIYGSDRKNLDDRFEFHADRIWNQPILSWKNTRFPVFLNAVSFRSHADAITDLELGGYPAGVRTRKQEKKIIRLGFDLFQEVEHVLRKGQPPEHACIPTIDLHIELLRDLILSAGIPVVEVVPTPANYRFIACLTHDVDFAGIRRHKFDRTLFGFLYRASLGSLVHAFTKGFPWNKVLQNWMTLVTLPLVYLGIRKDFMIQFDRYMDIENGHLSTFFFIPFKNRPGSDHAGRTSSLRSVKYDVDDVRPEIGMLTSRGCEIGLHGIDAWRSAEHGRDEMKRISAAADNSCIGVRMHWLYYTEQSPRLLEEAGFAYDSSVGYNETVGYRAGTAQVFRPFGTEMFYELPLHVMDTALFYPTRMGLTEPAARRAVNDLIGHVDRCGGVLTVNWHHRSIGPERFWDDFYIALLKDLQKAGAWCTGARQAVQWFKKRRSVRFSDALCLNDRLRVTISMDGDHDPELLLRVHYHDPLQCDQVWVPTHAMKRMDLPLKGSVEIDLTLQ